jgi:hypothetical protein
MRIASAISLPVAIIPQVTELSSFRHYRAVIVKGWRVIFLACTHVTSADNQELTCELFIYTVKFFTCSRFGNLTLPISNAIVFPWREQMRL